MPNRIDDRAAGERQFLVSAYDVAASDPVERASMTEALRDTAAHGGTILLDSGNYESFWNGDRSWSAERLATVLRETSASIAFCFDNQTPDLDHRVAADEVVSAVVRDQATLSHLTICPIVHGSVDSLASVVRSVAERLQPPLLAVAERELGDGVVARAATIRRLQGVLDQVAQDTALHVLGTGSPIAMLIYSIAGAQSFDGLEWCRTCVDPDSARLHHFHHRDLVRTLEPETTSTLPYVAATLVHNLSFFRTWTARIRNALAKGEGDVLLASVLPPARSDKVLTALRSM